MNQSSIYACLAHFSSMIYLLEMVDFPIASPEMTEGAGVERSCCQRSCGRGDDGSQGRKKRQQGGAFGRGAAAGGWLGMVFVQAW